MDYKFIKGYRFAFVQSNAYFSKKENPAHLAYISITEIMNRMIKDITPYYPQIITSIKEKDEFKIKSNISFFAGYLVGLATIYDIEIITFYNNFVGDFLESLDTYDPTDLAESYKQFCSYILNTITEYVATDILEEDDETEEIVSLPEGKTYNISNEELEEILSLLQLKNSKKKESFFKRLKNLFSIKTKATTKDLITK